MTEPASGGKHSAAASVVTALLSTIITYLLCEGLYAVYHWDSADGTLGYRIYAELRDRAGAQRVAREQAVVPVAGAADFEALLPAMKAAAVGIGDSPYTELQSDRAAINHSDARGCLRQKPNLDKRVTALRSNAFNPFEPPSLFVDATQAQTPALESFVQRYGVRALHHRSNAHGERLTLPMVERPDKVLIAGDSVAAGLMVDDSETLASQLQAADAERQYVNLGIGGADAADVFCALEDAVQRHAGSVRELIYIYCENDLQPGTALGTPQAVMAALAALVRREQIDKVTVIYAPYIYNVMPSLTRFKGHRGYRRPYHSDERTQLATLSHEAGFRYIDIGTLGLEENRQRGTDFAAFALYVDQVHLSPAGTAMLAARLRAAEQSSGDPTPQRASAVP